MLNTIEKTIDNLMRTVELHNIKKGRSTYSKTKSEVLSGYHGILDEYKCYKLGSIQYEGDTVDLYMANSNQSGFFLSSIAVNYLYSDINPMLLMCREDLEYVKRTRGKYVLSKILPLVIAHELRHEHQIRRNGVSRIYSWHEADADSIAIADTKCDMWAYNTMIHVINQVLIWHVSEKTDANTCIPSIVKWYIRKYETKRKHRALKCWNKETYLPHATDEYNKASKMIIVALDTNLLENSKYTNITK